jgi:citrate lyase subunit beta/citryl-CoA lyase
MKPIAPESGPAYLFCPASRPDRYQKALDAADFAIFDLEDAVAPADKAAARQALIDNPVDRDAVIVRVNAIGTPDHVLDLEALKQTGYGRIMVPKAEDPEAIATLGRYEVIALCETARGVLRAPEIAEVGCVVALMWGAEDLIASTGGRASRRDDGTYLDVAVNARSTVLLAAAASGKHAIDAVYIDMADDAGLRDETRDAADCGFVAKACVHPRQVPVIGAAWLPTPQQLRRARKVAATLKHQALGVTHGSMVDSPAMNQARAILAADQRSDAPLR